MLRKTISKKKGQAVIESVLIMVMLVGLSLLLFNTTIKEQGWMNQLVGEPSKYLKGMAETGQWVKVNAGNMGNALPAEHPNRRGLMNVGIEANK